MMSYREIYEITEEFKEWLRSQYYSESYTRDIVMKARRLLREFGDVEKVDEKAIWQRYMNYSKGYRHGMMSALKLFRKFLRECGINGED